MNAMYAEGPLLIPCCRGSLGDSKNGDLGISSNMKNPGRNNISICVNELLKQGALRGYHNIIDKCPHSEFIHRTVSQYVTLFTVQSTTAKHMPFNIENNNKLGIQEPTSIDRSITPEIQKLVARTEHLVFSSFVSTGSMSPRIVAIATLLMSVFTNESPVSEKILRIYRRILNEILPSEQLHRDYSTANISIKAWNLLFQRDPELYHHLQKHALEYDFVSLHVDEGSTLNSGTASGGAPETQLNPEMSEERIPQCSSNDKEQDTENLQRLAMPLLVEYALDVRSGSGTAKSRVEISTSNSNSKIHEKSTSSVNSDTAIATSPPSDGNTGHISLAIDKKSLLNHKRTKQQSDIDSENNNKSGVNSLGSATPPALYMLKGWLECGFCGGWFNSYTSLYIWDVLLCFGWDYESGITTTGSNTHTSTHSPAVVENMLPIICCILLQVRLLL